MADLITTALRITVKSPDGTVPQGAYVTADLVNYQGFPTIGLDNGIIVPNKVTDKASVDGTVLLDLWPNTRGAGDTQYRLTLGSTTKKFATLLVVVPEVSSGIVLNLEDVIVLTPTTPIDYSALLLARLAALEAEVELLRNGVITPDIPEYAVLVNGQAIVTSNGDYVVYPSVPSNAVLINNQAVLASGQYVTI